MSTAVDYHAMPCERVRRMRRLTAAGRFWLSYFSFIFASGAVAVVLLALGRMTG